MSSSQRQNVIDALIELYQTIHHMSGQPFADLQTAPPDGHVLPEALESALQQHQKSTEVVELVRHLPFAPIHLAPGSECQDYLHEHPDPYWLHQAWRPVRFGPSEKALVLPEELPLTSPVDGAGNILVIDTRDWSARVYKSIQSHVDDCTVHSDGCPLLCRHQRGLEVRPAVEILQRWKRNYLERTWMVDRSPPDVIDQSWPEEYVEKVRETYVVHGWPEDFQALECRQALENLPPVGDDYYTFGDE